MEQTGYAQNTLSSGSRLYLKLAPIALQSLRLPLFAHSAEAWFRIIQSLRLCPYPEVFPPATLYHYNCLGLRALRISPEFDDVADHGVN